MGLFNRHSDHATNGAAVHGSHHPTRDGLLAGAVAHHESPNHPDRNTALAAGGIGALEHHRNEKQLAREDNAIGNGTTTHGHHFGNGAATTGAGVGTGAGLGANTDINGHPSGLGASGVNGGYGGSGVGNGAALGANTDINGRPSGEGARGLNGGYGGTGVGAGSALGANTDINGRPSGLTGVGAAGANTGPAPIHGTTAANRTSASSGVAPSLNSVKEANKLERKGKLESTLADLTCSSNLRAKSQNHLAQADHLRMQASELGEAERLENEAGMRRQRAVGLGADPTHASGTTGFGPNNGVNTSTTANRTAAVV